MSDERRKVLEMVASGTITPEDADRLLEKLTSRESDAGSAAVGPVEEADVDDDRGARPHTADAAGPTPSGATRSRDKLRWFRVVVDSNDGDNVNIRLPMGLLRTGLKLSTMMPSKVSRKLAERGIDLPSLGQLADDELIEQLREFNVDVQGEGGETVRIFCE